MFSDWDPIDNALFTHHITTVDVNEAAAAADKNLMTDGTISDNIEDRFAYLLSSF